MFCCCILVLSIQVANSSFNYTAINYTENTISTLDDEVNVNVNIRKKSNNVSTTIEYFTPTNITWTHNISSTNSKGESVYSEFDVSANYKNEDTDRYLVCYDVNDDGSYTEINRHDTSKGTEQIKSLKFLLSTSAASVSLPCHTVFNSSLHAFIFSSNSFILFSFSILFSFQKNKIPLIYNYIKNTLF